jgi:hypothetical protein
MAEATLDHLAVVESRVLAAEPGHHDTRRFELPRSLSATRNPVPKVWRSPDGYMVIVKTLHRVGDKCTVRAIGVVAQRRRPFGRRGYLFRSDLTPTRWRRCPPIADRLFGLGHPPPSSRPIPSTSLIVSSDAGKSCSFFQRRYYESMDCKLCNWQVHRGPCRPRTPTMTRARCQSRRQRMARWN